jgi:hypothetical protein
VGISHVGHEPSKLNTQKETTSHPTAHEGDAERGDEATRTRLQGCIRGEEVEEIIVIFSGTMLYTLAEITGAASPEHAEISKFCRPQT